jgi:PilZ domain
LHARLIRYTFERKRETKRESEAPALKESMKKYGGQERRRAQRLRVNFKARWEGAWARREGHITDLSAVGCFILTPDLVKPGEPVKLEIQLPKGEIKIEGQVVYKIEEMGFAIEFTAASAEDRKRLAWLIRAEAQLAQRK